MRKKRIKMFMVAALVICLAVFLGRLPVFAADYGEAPELRILVAAGVFPPVEERLPDEPLVVESAEIGVYGGTLTTTTWPPHYMTDEYIITTEVPGYVKPAPNVIEAWEINADATEVTFYLRKGMKWSDGALFTADDWMFWYNDYEGNVELTPIKRTWYEIGGEHGVLSKIDDYTIKWTFVETFGSFLDSLAEWPTRGRIQFLPAHYLKQFHPDYATDLEAKMKAGGFDTWMDLFGTKKDDMNNPELPTLGAWTITNPKDSVIQIWIRNPYYWKVDPEGNQLPYVDSIEVPRDPGTEANLIKLIAGEFDFLGMGGVGALANFTIVMENQEKGDYRLIRITEGTGAANVGTMFLNVSHKNPAKRELFNNLDFRKALSVALNRREIIDVGYKGVGVPTQVSPATGPPYYGEDPRYKDYYTQYDPELANELLDGIGLTERDGDGYRLGPDGEKLLIVLNVISHWVPALPDIADMYKIYFAAVGINTIVKPAPEEPIYEIVNALDHDIFIRFFAGGNWLQSPANGYLFPRDSGWHTAPAWARWILTDGETGEEPPDWVKRLAAIDGEAKAEVDLQTRFDLYTEAVLLHVNNLMPIGVWGVAGGPTSRHIINNRVRNVVEPNDMHFVGGSGQLSSWYIAKEDQ